MSLGDHRRSICVLFLSVLVLGSEPISWANSLSAECFQTLIAYRPIHGIEANALAAEYSTASPSRQKQIFQRFVHAYVLMARKAARAVYHRNRSLELEDLEQIALASIAGALGTYQITKGPFFAHAQSRMEAYTKRHAMEHYADNGVILSTLFSRWYYSNRGRLLAELSDRLSRKDSDQELQLDPEVVARIYNEKIALKVSRARPVDSTTVREVENSYQLQSPKSLFVPLNTSSDASTATLLVDVIESRQISQLDRLDRKRTITQVARELITFRDTLNPFERSLFELRILPLLTEEGEDPVSLGELGRSKGVSGERARQIQVRIISRLKEHLLKSGIEPPDHLAQTLLQ